MPEAPTAPIALVDLGDTLADCTPALADRLASLANSTIPGDEQRRAVLSTPGFWRGLAPRRRGFELLDLLRRQGFEVHVVTKGPRDAPHVWAEKVAWCREHLPGLPVLVCDDKTRVHGHVLVDDWLPYVDRWLAQWPDGLAIVPAQQWNADAASRERCVRDDGANRAELTAALRGLRDRLG